MSSSGPELRPLARRVEVTDDELLGDGEGIHWPIADEDLSVAGLLAGSRSAGTRAA